MAGQPASPALTTTSMSSYGMASPRPSTPRSSTSSLHRARFESDDDEIVWGLASNPSIASDPDVDDDDDFVVLSRRQVPGLTLQPENPESGAATPVEETTRSRNLTDTARSGDSTNDIIEALHSQLRDISLDCGSAVDVGLDTLPALTRNGLEAEPESPRSVLASELDGEQKECSGKVVVEGHGLPTPDVSPKRERKNLAEVAPSLTAPPLRSGISTMKKSKKSKKAKKLAKDSTTTANSNAAAAGDGVKKGKKKKKKASKKAERAAAQLAQTAGAGAVDPGIFQEASTYISSFLSSPEAKNNSVCRLTLLQSLIIELGLISSALNLPASLRSARLFLKTRAFLNIREYISVREQGQQAIRKLLYPSRSALIKDIRKKRNTVSLKWVKDHGLQVLLVGCFHH